MEKTNKFIVIILSAMFLFVNVQASTVQYSRQIKKNGYTIIGRANFTSTTPRRYVSDGGNIITTPPNTWFIVYHMSVLSNQIPTDLSYVIKRYQPFFYDGISESYVYDDIIKLEIYP